MGNCNINCCKCIEKKETKFIHNISLNSNISHETRLKLLRPIDLSKIIINPKSNMDNKKDEKNYIYTIEENSRKERFNDNTNEDYNDKDIFIKYFKKKIKDRNLSPNKRYDNFLDTLKKENEKENNSHFIIRDNNKLIDGEDKEEDIEVKDIKSPLILPRYFRTNFKSNKNSYMKYFEKIEESKNNLDMTHKYKIKPNNIINSFPIKYNYQKDKYITYFTDDNI